METFPEDILLEIQKYSPKVMSSTCRSLRSKFNIYDYWIPDYKILEGETYISNVVNFVRYYIFGSTKKPGVILDRTKVVKLKITPSIKYNDLESYPNLQQIKLEKPISGLFATNFRRFKKIYFSEVNTIGSLYFAHLMDELIEQNENLEIEVDNIIVGTTRALLDLIYEKLKILKISIYFPVTKEVLDVFMNEINCDLLIVQGVTNTYNILNSYTDTKPGKKVRVICLDNTEDSEILKNIDKDWMEIRKI